MPQLMPLLWVFSFFMIMYLMIVSVVLYDNVYDQFSWMNMESVGVKNKIWKW